MSDKIITIRFVTCDEISSIAIREQAKLAFGVSMPFIPSHTEALSRIGDGWTGQHIDGGCMKRPLDYYNAFPNPQEKRVLIPATDAEFAAFHDYLEARIGDPYDWRAILGFVLPDIGGHKPGGEICSALMTMCARAANNPFKFPLTVPAHHISPCLLMLLYSSHLQIDH